MMKRYKIPLIVAALAALVGAAYLTDYLLPRPQARRPDMGSALQAGVGQVTIASTTQQVTSSLNSVGSFFNYRANFSLPSAITSSLSTLETQTINGQLPRLTTDEIGTALTNALHWRLAQLTDPQLEDMCNNSLRVYPSYVHPTRPAQPRADSRLEMAPAVLFHRAKEYRDGSTPQALLWRAAAAGYIRDEVKMRADQLTNAGIWTSPANYSPVQGFIFGYSFVSDDSLAHGQPGLQAAMQHWEDYLFSLGVPRDLGSRPAFGVNGYMYKTPLSLLFNQATMAKFIEEMEKEAQQ